MESSEPTKKRGKGLAIAVSFAISIGLLAFLFADVEWAVLKATLQRVNLLYVPLLAFLILFSMWLRALRWRYLLPNGGDLSLSKLTNATLIGFLATWVLPLRAGEFIRPWFLSRIQPVNFSTAFGSIVIERVFDVLAILLLLGLCLPQIESAPELVTVGATALAALAGVILLLMLASYLASERILGLAERVLSWCFSTRHPELRDKLVSMATELIEGLRSISSLRDLGFVVLYSLILWGETALLYQATLWTFGEFPSFWVGAMVTVMIALAVAAPSAPGFLGTFQFGCAIALSYVYSYPNEFALGYSVFNHVVQAIVIVGAGFFVLHREKLGLGDLVKQRDGMSTA